MESKVEPYTLQGWSLYGSTLEFKVQLIHMVKIRVHL